MSVEVFVPLALAVLGACAWFMSMIAGALLDGRRWDSLKSRLWYVCSLAAVEFLVVFGWMIGRYAPH